MIIIKTDKEIEKMRRAGQRLARLLDELLPKIVKEGTSAEEIELYVLKYVDEVGGIPTFKGYAEYPYATNISVNEEVVHGFPLKEKIFKYGDLVSVDCGITLDGYVADSARTYIVGEVNEEERKLVEATKESLLIGAKQAIIGNRIGDIGHAVQEYIEGQGFSVIRDFVGHGVGRKLHEDPQVPNYGKMGKGPKIRKNMTLAIEPMVAMGDWQVKILDDGWTTITRDGSKAAHFEYTVAVTENGPEVLTSLEYNSL
ncbi:type I methionyl aminopeptidase [Oceanotoga sp. DSM 15011]|uniref:type I methionyl aminopeptidase n=1 Tax=Oceanotoga sp. DSM 15011 TaxID=2984951 RepID=UPI0021F4D42A|nr:type I methionyl aminopeptidase [Oceanotoga sp. DSM 15011]UYO99868.1 type I methionyl aminopeptidase [Oceanotoga sp. DSM 15011]